MEEFYFWDEHIVEQSSVTIKTKRGLTNGISLIVDPGPGSDGVEILLIYEELKKALEGLEKDREAFDYDY